MRKKRKAPARPPKKRKIHQKAKPRPRPKSIGRPVPKESPEDYLPLPQPRVRQPLFSERWRLEANFELALKAPKVSVVVVNFDGVDLLWNCLFALKTQTYPPFEVILVDNASNDASVPFVKANYPQVKILECDENFGYAMGCNLGVKTATGDLVVFLNNDAVVTPDWLARMVKEFQDGWPDLGALAGMVKSKQMVEGSPTIPFLAPNFLGNPVEGHLAEVQSVFYPDGCAFLYPRFLAAEGPFDPEYFIYQEDFYFGWRLRLEGKEVARSRTAKVFHDEGGTMSRGADWKIVYYKTRNRWLNLFLFYGTANLLKVLPWVGLEALWRLVKGLFTGFDLFAGTLLASFWILAHPRGILRKRLEIQGRRKVRDEEVLRCFSGRVAPDGGLLSRPLNFISLLYCAAVGLPVMESKQD